MAVDGERQDPMDAVVQRASSVPLTPGDAAEVVDVSDVFRTALDNMLDSVAIDRAVRDASGTIVDFVIEYLNPVASDLAGRGRDELIGQLVLEAYPGLDENDLFDAYCEVVDTGRPAAFDAHPYRAEIDGREVTAWFHVRAARLGPDRLLIVTRDVTADREATEHLEDAVRQLEAAQALAHIGIWQYDVASGAFEWSDELARIFGLDPDVSVEERTRAYHRVVSHEDRAELDRLAQQAMIDGRPFLADHTLHLPTGETAHTVVHGDVVRDDTGAVVRVWGTLQDVTESTRTEYALEATTSELEREHATTDALQRAILPELPHLGSLELAACYLPAGTEAKVGGDWYDVFVLDDDRIGLVVGDVAGHGLPSAALMAQLRNGLRAYALQGSGPAETLTQLNHFLRAVHRDAYATCLYGIYEPGSGRFTWAHAGHLPPMVIDARVGTFLESGRGTPLGALRDAVYVERSVTLAPESCLVVYTDGLIERRGEVIDRGLDRLIGVVGELVLEHFDDFCVELSCARARGRRAGRRRLRPRRAVRARPSGRHRSLTGCATGADHAAGRSAVADRVPGSGMIGAGSRLGSGSGMIGAGSRFGFGSGMTGAGSNGWSGPVSGVGTTVGSGSGMTLARGRSARTAADGGVSIGCCHRSLLRSRLSSGPTQRGGATDLVAPAGNRSSSTCHVSPRPSVSSGAPRVGQWARQRTEQGADTWVRRAIRQPGGSRKQRAASPATTTSATRARSSGPRVRSRRRRATPSTRSRTRSRRSRTDRAAFGSSSACPLWPGPSTRPRPRPATSATASDRARTAPRTGIGNEVLTTRSGFLPVRRNDRVGAG